MMSLPECQTYHSLAYGLVCITSLATMVVSLWSMSQASVAAVVCHQLCVLFLTWSQLRICLCCHSTQHLLLESHFKLSLLCL
jgi:hypothetical protein